MSITKKISMLLLVFTFFGSSAFAQEKKQKVTDDALSKFVVAFDNLEKANSEAQQEMVLLVKEEGMEMKRFNEIHVAFVNSNMDSNATPEEIEKHKRIMDQVQKIQGELQNEMDDIVKKSGLSINKYQKIAEKLESDPVLRERYAKLANTKTVQ